MFGRLRGLRQLVLEALRRNGEQAARLINHAIAARCIETSASHPASRVTSELSWQEWDGGRWRRLWAQTKESD
jgi:hypothetical protein